jgi:hypothetical protein
MGSTQAWMDLFALGYAAYLAFFAGAAVILVYAILLAAGTSVAQWIVERFESQVISADAATWSSDQNERPRTG